MSKDAFTQAFKGEKSIRLPCELSQHKVFTEDKDLFRTFLDDAITKTPELLPSKIENGYILYGKTRSSKKIDNLKFRRIQLTETKEIYTVYPTCVMPNLIAYTKDVEEGLFLRKFSVPYHALVRLYGRNEMFWYRAEKSFGRNNIVGVTVKKK